MEVSSFRFGRIDSQNQKDYGAISQRIGRLKIPVLDKQSVEIGVIMAEKTAYNLDVNIFWKFLLTLKKKKRSDCVLKRTYPLRESLVEALAALMFICTDKICVMNA